MITVLDKMETVSRDYIVKRGSIKDIYELLLFMNREILGQYGFDITDYENEIHLNYDDSSIIVSEDSIKISGLEDKIDSLKLAFEQFLRDEKLNIILQEK